jgi:hypothetical protein
MAKLTRKQRTHLNTILHDAQRALDYIMSEDVAVARRSRRAGTSLDYTRAPLSPEAAAALRVPEDGGALSIVAKDAGSHLCGLPAAVNSLRAFLALEDN